MSKDYVFSCDCVLTGMSLSGFRPTDTFRDVQDYKGGVWERAVVRILSHEKGHVFDTIHVLMGSSEKEASKREYLVTFLDVPTVQNLREAYDLADRDAYPTWKQHLLKDHKKVIALKSHLDNINRVQNPYPLPDNIELIQSMVPHEGYDTKGDPTMFIIKLNNQTTYRIDGKFDSWDYGNPEMVTYRNILEMKKVKLQEKVITVYE